MDGIQVCIVFSVYVCARAPYICCVYVLFALCQKKDMAPGDYTQNEPI